MVLPVWTHHRIDRLGIRMQETLVYGSASYGSWDSYKFEIISYTRSISYLTTRGVTMDNSCEKVPIHLKVTLTIREAAEYSNIGINKIDQLLRQPNCPFVLYVGAKRLVKRKEFEEYLNKMLTI